MLRFGAGIDPGDIHYSRNGNDLDLLIGATSDRVTLLDQDNYFHTGVFGAISYDRIERIEFADGTVWTWQQLNSRVIDSETTSGDDIIDGFMMADHFKASAGNDIMRGGDSSDTYEFEVGSGDDTIVESVSNLLYGNSDKIVFNDINLDDVSFLRSGEDLVVIVKDTNDRITVEKHFHLSTLYLWHDVEIFEFADGTVLTDIDVQDILLQSTPGNDNLLGSSRGETLDGGAGDDTLAGGDGRDTYVFDRGYGHDTIQEYVSSPNISDYDVVQFGPGIAPGDLTFSRSGGDLIITITDTGETLKIFGQLNHQSWFTWTDVEVFKFGDGTQLNKSDIEQILLTGTPGDDHLVGFFDSDTLDGGAGDDILEGVDGSDTYRFGLGYGHDVIHETLTDGNLPNHDVVEMGEGISPEDVRVSRVGQGLVMTLASGETLTVSGQFIEGYNEALTYWDIEEVRFKDGTVWDKADIVELAMIGSNDADLLVGTDAVNTIDGLSGDDLFWAPKLLREWHQNP